MIFDIVKGQPVLTAEALTIPIFRDIWENDKSQLKTEAFDKCTYIYHAVDPRSAYKDMSVTERKLIVDRDHLTKKGLKLDKQLQAAVDEYHQDFVQKKPALALLRGVESQFYKLGRYMEETEVDDKTIDKIVRAIEKAAVLVGSHQTLVEKVEQQLQLGTKIKKDIKPNQFDDEYNG